MSVTSALVALVTGNPLVSNLIAARMYPTRLPENVTLPAIKYQVIDTIPNYAHDGDLGWDTVRIQLDMHGATATDAMSVRDAVRSAVTGFRGISDTETIDGIRIASILQDHDPELNQYREIMDLLVQHRRKDV